MEEKIICFCYGLSPGDIEKGKESFGRMHPGVSRPDVVSLTGAMMDLPVGEVLGQTLFGADSKAEKDGADPQARLSSDDKIYRTVIVHTTGREQVFQVMRSFKAVLPEPQDIVFAVVTPTALGWLFKDYIVHLAQEHEEMKNHRAGSSDKQKT